MTEAIHLIVSYAFESLIIHKLWGGYYSKNIGSGKALRKNGFKIEGCLKKEIITSDGTYDDYIIVGLLSKDYNYRR